MVTVSQRKRTWQEAICWEILWGRIFAKYYPQIFSSRFAKYYQLKYLFAKSLSIEFNQEDENLKVSTQRNSTEFCFPPDREYILIFVRLFKYLLGNFIRSIFNFVLSQILPIFAACKKKVLETSGFASCFVCHFLPPVRPSQNFPKLSVATNN